ncbi:MAG: ATP-dependent zinc metalloprotease FtsH [Anaerolineales bacterium]
MNSARIRSAFVYILIIVAIVVLLFQFRQPVQSEVIDLPDLASHIRNGEVSKITVDENTIKVTLKENRKEVVARIEPGQTAASQLRDFNVTPEQLAAIPSYQVEEPSQLGGILTFLGYMLPALLVVGVIYFMLRQAQGSNNQAMSFGKSRARMFNGDHPTVTFEDVAGIEESKEELREIVEFLKEPDKFIALGARIPKGVLLVGHPGTGKTLLSKAVAGEAGVPFFSISGSEFVEMFVGVGASRVRDLFDQAKRHSPCIIFVDEIDAVGRHRGAGLGGSHDEREQTLNQILVEMDGFDTDTNIIVIAATNRPDILDPALMRPGRFDRRVVLDRPDMKGREAIIKVHVRGKPLASDVDASILSKSTPGFVGADLENMVNEAAILAARRNKKAIGHKEFEEAIERVIAGPERKSRLISEDEKRVIAYHEAGHAVVMHALVESDPVHKVSIIARGMAGGYTLSLPDEDRTLATKRKFLADLAGLLGGRAAEEIVFGDITTGASNDMERVTKISRSMVTRWGMSEKMGPMVYGQKEELIFLGREISEQRDYSDAVAEQIDGEVRDLVTAAYERARSILTQYRDKLDAIADRLIEIETIDAAEFNRLFPSPIGRKQRPLPPAPSPSAPSSTAPTLPPATPAPSPA